MPRLVKLKAIRERKALSQQELADQAGINRVTLARIEAGAEPYPATIRKLAEALGVVPETIMESREDICEGCGHLRGSHGTGSCGGPARHRGEFGETPILGCERNCQAFVEMG